MTQVYDIGVHYIPDDEGKAGMYIEEVKKLVESMGGTVLSADEPEQKELSYEVNGKNINTQGVYPRYQQSLFFSIRCECSDIQKVDTALEKDADVLRHIVVKTDKDASFVDPALYVKKEDEKKPSKPSSEARADGESRVPEERASDELKVEEKQEGEAEDVYVDPAPEETVAAPTAAENNK